MKPHISTLALLLAITLAVQPLSGQSGATDLKTMTIKQMTAKAADLVRTMESNLQASFKLLDEAINQNKPGTINTRNEAITAMKGLEKLSELNLMTLQEKAAKTDKAGVEHEYVKISIAAAKVAELYAQVRSADSPSLEDFETTDFRRKLDIGGVLPPAEQLSSSSGPSNFELKYTLDDFITGDGLDKEKVSWTVSADAKKIKVDYQEDTRTVTLTHGSAPNNALPGKVTFTATLPDGRKASHTMTIKRKSVLDLFLGNEPIVPDPPITVNPFF